MSETVRPLPKSIRKYFPPWFPQIMYNFVAEYKSLGQILRLTTGAISFLKLTPDMLKELDALDASIPKKQFPLEIIQKAEHMSTLAEKEISSDFPLIRGQTAVGLWAILEATMLDIAASWIYHDRNTLGSESISKIRIRVSDYDRMNRRDRAEYLVEQLQKDLGFNEKQGVSRFESLLSNFYKTEELPPLLRKTLFELSQVRNAIVHRAYRTDRLLIKCCPWLHLKKGERLQVTGDMLSRYFSAVGLYIEWTCYSASRHFGNDATLSFKEIATLSSALVSTRRKRSQARAAYPSDKPTEELHR